MQYTSQLSSWKMTGTEHSLTRRRPSNVYRVSYVHFLWPSSYNTICLPPQTLGSAHHGISKRIISVRNITGIGRCSNPARPRAITHRTHIYAVYRSTGRRIRNNLVTNKLQPHFGGESYQIWSETSRPAASAALTPTDYVIA